MKKTLLAICMMITGSALADPPLSKTVDFSGSTAPAIQTYQANTRTITWTLKNNNAAVNGSGYSPVMWIAASNRASSVVTAACTWATQTSGIFNAVFSSASLNTNGSWVYGVGISSGAVTTARQGTFTIIPDPYATGAGAIAFAVTNVDWSVYYFSNTTNGSLVAGSNITFRLAGTRGQYAIDSASQTTQVSIAYAQQAGTAAVASAYAETDPIWTAASSSYVAKTDTNGWVVSSHSPYLTSETNWTSASNNVAYLDAGHVNNFLARPTVTGVTVMLTGEVAPTSAFTGSGTTGTVTSSSTDVANEGILKANGTWTNTTAWVVAPHTGFITSNGVTTWADSKFYPSNNPNSFATTGTVVKYDGGSYTSALWRFAANGGTNQMLITPSIFRFGNSGGFLNFNGTNASLSAGSFEGDGSLLTNIPKQASATNADHATTATTAGTATNLATVVVGNIITNNSSVITGIQSTQATHAAILSTNYTSVADWKAQLDPMGFVNETQWNLVYTQATRTVYLSPKGVSADYYFAGNKITKTGMTTIQISTNLGTHFVYFNDVSGSLIETNASWGFSNAVQVCTVFQTIQPDGTTNSIIGDELHEAGMDWNTHRFIHSSIGTRYVSGLTGSFALTNFTLTSGVIMDEDLQDTIGQTNRCRIFYHVTNNPVLQMTFSTNGLILTNGNVALYDPAGTGTNSVPVNNYFAMWVYATSSHDDPIMFVMGQRVDSSLANARANNTIDSLVLGNLPSQEMKILYRLIFHRGTGAGVPVYDEAQDLRSVSTVPSGTFVATSHGSLSGLLNDDHTQYELVDGTRAMTGFENAGTYGMTNASYVNATTGIFANLSIGSTAVNTQIVAIGNIATTNSVLMAFTTNSFVWTNSPVLNLANMTGTVNSVNENISGVITQSLAAGTNWINGNLVVNGIISNTPVYCYVYSSTNVPYTAGVNKKVIYDTIITNVGAGWDAANKYFKPSIKGWYNIFCTIQQASTNGSTANSLLLYKNGVSTNYIAHQLSSGLNVWSTGSGRAYLDGVNDYLEVYAVRFTYDGNIVGSNVNYVTSFQAHLTQKE